LGVFRDRHMEFFAKERNRFKGQGIPFLFFTRCGYQFLLH